MRGPQKLRERRVGFAVEWLMIVTATLVAAFAHPDAHNVSGQAVVALLALAMGLQNAMVRTHGVPDLATNVMTVTFTAIFADSKIAGGDNRNWRRVLSIGLFVASAALGALLLKVGIFWPLVLASIVFSVAMIPLLFGDHQSKQAGSAGQRPVALRIDMTCLDYTCAGKSNRVSRGQRQYWVVFPRQGRRRLCDLRRLVTRRLPGSCRGCF